MQSARISCAELSFQEKEGLIFEKELLPEQCGSSNVCPYISSHILLSGTGGALLPSPVILLLVQSNRPGSYVQCDDHSLH